MSDKQIYLVEKSEKGLRLDAFLAKQAGLSRSQAKKAIQEGQCTVDSLCVEPDLKVNTGQNIEFTPLIYENTLVPEKRDLDILYQDNDLVIINKTPNLTVHPAPSQKTGTLVHFLLSAFPQIAQMEGARPGIVHRIDKDTSGIIVIALHDKARRALIELFAKREVHKTYYALVHGALDKAGKIDVPIGRHSTYKTKMSVVEENKGKSALTTYTPIYFNAKKEFSLVKVNIHTGRTHQIRVHFAYLGYPLIGDTLYIAESKRKILPEFLHTAPRQMLHAGQISFKHPFTDKIIEIACDIPDDMKACFNSINMTTKKYIITGNSGSGKTALLHYLNTKNFPTWSADAIVKKLYAPDGSGTFLLRRALGAHIVPENKGVDSQALFHFMSLSHENKNLVESLIHPLVAKDMESFFEKAEKNKSSLAFAEVPLYFESPYFIHNKEYKVITISSNQIKERLEKRGWSASQQKIMDSWQLAQNEKEKKSDYIIQNNSSLEYLYLECEKIVM